MDHSSLDSTISSPMLPPILRPNEGIAGGCEVDRTRVEITAQRETDKGAIGRHKMGRQEVEMAMVNRSQTRSSAERQDRCHGGLIKQAPAGRSSVPYRIARHSKLFGWRMKIQGATGRALRQPLRGSQGGLECDSDCDSNCSWSCRCPLIR
ncbi:hypothetical protein BO94DRAFT_345998 [Aspergillus sclerotioniger CBS 115572]|uniref:Uncharacterized protein n=1 Tax=Aspergillus sclerotioniger CBS 115572 TaxID=1450535 RepID=A0A317X4L9_9EURO|nr:hypothetical protein BO94DRAFT_345998 [Aspergillus sclerotioniger CBS 115572]PWY93523.1 hypothetical protein BO94DRAFT_345998 [Aspergillus sclerotioniger CBS 115572]